jgi:hypothetical protein
MGRTRTSTYPLARIFHELLSRDYEDGRATRSAGACAACRATTGGWFRGVPKRYVAGADTRGRQEGRPYPWSQQVIHEISGLEKGDVGSHLKNEE